MRPADQLAQRFLTGHPQAAADLLAGLSAQEAAEALSGLEPGQALAVLAYLPRLTAARMLEYWPPAAAADLLAMMPLRDSVELLRRSVPRRRDAYLHLLPARTARALRTGLERLRLNVGALMDTRVPALPVEMTVERARALVEQVPDDAGCQFYLTDAAGRLAGSLSPRALYAAHPHQRLKSLPLAQVTPLPEGARSDSVVGHPGWQQATQLPVVDAEGRFVGVLSRTRLAERAPGSTADTDAAPLNMVLTFLEGYAAGAALLLELLMRGTGRRGG